MSIDVRGIEPRFAHYAVGRAPAWALQSDQRFSYYAYVPPTLYESPSPSPRLIVAIHGTERSAESCRDAFVELAEEHGCVVLAPLFPCGILDGDDLDNYKRLEFHGVRFDLLLIEMIDEVASRYRIERDGFERFLLYGFSGGGQFVHRFLYLHPERLRAVSIGAPGAVTLLDDNADWWVGTRNIFDVFGKGIDTRTMQNVEVQMVIGGEDFGSDEVMIPASSKHWMEGANRAGADRQSRLAALRRALEAAGMTVEADTVHGVGHDGSAVLPAVKDFFARVLNATRI